VNGIIAHEWVEPAGGAEQVLDAFADAFPDAGILALWSDAPHRYAPGRVRETWLSRTPFRRSKALALPLMHPTWRGQWAAEDLDWALISSHLFAHHVRFRNVPKLRKYAYVHTPARYLWTPELDPRGDSKVVRAVAPILRKVDLRAAAEIHRIAANSHFVRQRIRDAWRRDAEVIYPPVNTSTITAQQDWSERLTPEERGQLEQLPTEFVLGASRLVEYKRLDDVIDCAQANGVPAVIAGSGPDLARLKTHGAQRQTHFVPHPSTAMLYALYQRALAYVFPPVEDFGIMPVEAMAAGARVIVNSQGGAAESVEHGVSGVHANSFQGDDARKALASVESINVRQAVERASQFSRERFIRQIQNWVQFS
jgi:glycosyltransferase involved in cell wall biosynthesis